jgi:hypothetical protein
MALCSFFVAVPDEIYTLRDQESRTAFIADLHLFYQPPYHLQNHEKSR